MITFNIAKTILIIGYLLMVQSYGQKISDVLKAYQPRIFQNYKQKYSKKYKDQSEQLYRNLLVYSNANKIASHNLNTTRTYSLGINAFADLSQDQFKLKYAGYQVAGESLKENIRLEKKRKEIDQRQCLCDNRMNQITLIQQRNQIIKSYLNSTKEQKKKRKDQSLLSVQNNITQFQQNMLYLPLDQFQVTFAMKKQIQANLTKKITPTLQLSSTISTANLQKDDSVATNRVPTAISIPKAIITSVKLEPALSTKTVAPPLTTLQKQVLNSLGDPSIATPKQNTTILSSPLLKQTLSTTTPTPTTTTTMITSPSITTATISTSTISIDWSNYTGAAHHQGLCGSCYAMVAAENVQALYAIYSFGFYVQLSTQQIIDCSDNGLTFGCDGGYIEGSLLHIKNKGVTTQAAYPYTSGLTGTAGTCKTATGPFKITQFRNLVVGDCAGIKQQLAKKPVSVAIASFNLQFYQSGTFTGCNNEIDHAVLLVGFDSTKGWKIKNSWGTSWGEAGYAWIQDGNSCGICQGGIVASIAGEPISR